jgi:hypothetical protein
MSFTKNTDVKNHLSARHRTEIHLQPAVRAEATGFKHEESAGPDPSENDSIENPLSPSPSSGQKIAAIVPPKSVQD